jgi:hypothetical protein
MAESKPGTRSGDNVGQFGEDLGDLRPISEFSGCQVPTQRETIQLYIHFRHVVKEKQVEAAKFVAASLVEKWKGANVSLKSRVQIQRDVLALYLKLR